MDLLSDIGGVLGFAQDGWNLFKDIIGLDYDRSYDLNSDLMGVQQGMTKENMELANQYNVEMWNRNKDFTQDMFNQSVQANKDFAAQQQQYNTENMAKQFQYNAMLSDAGRAIAQQRMAGINPNAVGAARSSGSVSQPASGLPSAPHPSSPGMAALGASTPASSNSTASHYMADANNLVEAGLKLDTKLDELRRRKGEATKAAAEGKISETEAANKQRMIDTAIETALANANAAQDTAQANWLQAQVDAGYKSAMIRIQDELTKLKERGVIIEEKKLQPTIMEILADAYLKKKQGELTYKDYLNYDEKLAKVLRTEEAKADSYTQDAKFTEKQANWYEVRAISGIIGDVVSKSAKVLNEKR